MGKIILDIMVIAVVYLVGYKMGVHQCDKAWSQALDSAVKETIRQYFREKENSKDESDT